MTVKILGSEVACNATPQNFSSRTVRVINTTAPRTLTLKNVVKTVEVTVDTDVNATTLFILSSGNTEGFVAGYRIVNTSNDAVVNTNVTATVDSVVNSSAFVASADQIVANGTCEISVANAVYSFSMLGNTELTIDKGSPITTLESNNNSEVLATPVAFY